MNAQTSATNACSGSLSVYTLSCKAIVLKWYQIGSRCHWYSLPSTGALKTFLEHNHTWKGAHSWLLFVFEDSLKLASVSRWSWTYKLKIVPFCVSITLLHVHSKCRIAELLLTKGLIWDLSIFTHLHVRSQFTGTVFRIWWCNQNVQ